VIEKTEDGLRVSIAPPKGAEKDIKAMQEAEELSNPHNSAGGAAWRKIAI
jgi:hypothetical protein